MKLTILEIQGLQGICDSEYHDGRNPVNDPVWSWSANPFTLLSTFSGVVSSLVKKGWAISCGGGDEATITITQAGYDVLQGAQK